MINVAINVHIIHIYIFLLGFTEVHTTSTPWQVIITDSPDWSWKCGTQIERVKTFGRTETSGEEGDERTEHQEPQTNTKIIETRWLRSDLCK